jgi:transposase
MLCDISDENFIKFVKESFSYRDIVKKCGYKCLTNYKPIKKRISKLNLKTSHFDPYRYLSFHKNKKKLEDVCVQNSTYSRGHLKKRLFKELNWKKICCNCQATECISIETGEVIPIPLELDHINGINNDHRLENLRLVCPTCHATTSTFKGRNVKNKREKNKCIDCEKDIQRKSKRCKKCAGIKNNSGKRANWPSYEELKNHLDKLPYTEVGKIYGVSDNTIREWKKKMSATTSTFKVENVKHVKNVKKKCIDCNKEIYRRATRCISCAGKKREEHKIKARPSYEQLQKDLEDLKYYTKIAKKYNVSDKTIKKWINIYEKK